MQLDSFSFKQKDVDFIGFRRFPLCILSVIVIMALMPEEHLLVGPFRSDKFRSQVDFAYGLLCAPLTFRPVLGVNRVQKGVDRDLTEILVESASVFGVSVAEGGVGLVAQTVGDDGGRVGFIATLVIRGEVQVAHRRDEGCGRSNPSDEGDLLGYLEVTEGRRVAVLTVLEEVVVAVLRGSVGHCVGGIDMVSQELDGDGGCHARQGTIIGLTWLPHQVLGA